MNGGTGEGPHMWNIVANNGKYYMADITNSDEGTVGEDGGLFLDTPISGSISRGYIYATDSANIYFAYDKEAKSLYGTGKNSILYMTKETYSADENKMKHQIYDYAQERLELKEYDTAYELFQALSWCKYGDSAVRMKDVKYAYAQDESLNAGFGVSYDFFQMDGKVFYGPARQG